MLAKLDADYDLDRADAEIIVIFRQTANAGLTAISNNLNSADKVWLMEHAKRAILQADSKPDTPGDAA